MTHNNPNMNRRHPDDGRFDQEINSALAKYTGVEPRAGLEARVLANLRNEREHATNRSWRRWPVVAALAAVVIVSLFVASRLGKPAQNVVEQHSQAPARTNENVGARVASNRSGSARPHEASGKRPESHALSHTTATVVSAPKLDEFPSPQPLNEQERMLTEYVAEHHQQAVLIARARMEELEKDSAEEMEEAPASPNRQTSDQSVSQQEDR